MPNLGATMSFQKKKHFLLDIRKKRDDVIIQACCDVEEIEGNMSRVWKADVSQNLQIIFLK